MVSPGFVLRGNKGFAQFWKKPCNADREKGNRTKLLTRAEAGAYEADKFDQLDGLN